MPQPCPCPATVELVGRLEATDPEGRAYTVRVGRRYDTVIRNRNRLVMVDRGDGRLYSIDGRRRGRCMGWARTPWIFCYAWSRVMVDTEHIRTMNERDRPRETS